MAVVQISKIQIRRGSGAAALEGNDPVVKLSSGELAWGTDTQKLFIGSGTISEGAPTEKNVEILTESSELLELGNYIYGNVSTDLGSNDPVERTIQSRLDDRNNAHNFGVEGDATTDDSARINNAIEKLFKASLNGAGLEQTRTVLEFGPGIYLIREPIKIHSYTTIIGAGKGRTVFKYEPLSNATVKTFNASNIDSVTDRITINSHGFSNRDLVSYSSGQNNPINGLSNNSYYYVKVISANVIELYSNVALTDKKNISSGIGIHSLSPTTSAFIFDKDNESPFELNNQCRHVILRDFTLEVAGNSTTGMDLYCVRDSEFKNLELKSNWDFNFPNTNSFGFNMRVFSDIVTCKNNDFNNITINKFRFGIYAKGDVFNNTIQSSKFTELDVGVNLGYDPSKPTGTLDITLNQVGAKFGPRNTIISNCLFDLINQQGIKVYQGRGNTSSTNNFLSVGNDGSGNQNNKFGQVEFDVPNNLSLNDYSTRHKDLSQYNVTGSITAVPYIPEVTGSGYYQNLYTNTVNIAAFGDVNPKELFRFTIPTSSNTGNIGPDSCVVEVDYLYRDTGTNQLYRRLRKGVLTLILDSRNSSNTIPELNVIDHYDYLGNGNQNAQVTDQDEFLIFTGELEQKNTRWQVVVSYKYKFTSNPLLEKGQLTYTYKILS